MAFLYSLRAVRKFFLYSSECRISNFFWFSSMASRLSTRRWEMERTSKRTLTMSREMLTDSLM